MKCHQYVTNFRATSEALIIWQAIFVTKVCTWSYWLLKLAEPTGTSKVLGRLTSGGGCLGTIMVSRPSWHAAVILSKLALAGRLNLRMNFPALRSTLTYLISVSVTNSSRLRSPLIFNTLSFSTCTYRPNVLTFSHHDTQQGGS